MATCEDVAQSALAHAYRASELDEMCIRLWWLLAARNLLLTVAPAANLNARTSGDERRC